MNKNTMEIVEVIEEKLRPRLERGVRNSYDLEETLNLVKNLCARIYANGCMQGQAETTS